MNEGKSFGLAGKRSPCMHAGNTENPALSNPTPAAVTRPRAPPDRVAAEDSFLQLGEDGFDVNDRGIQELES
jgi:hypothetical protein